MSRAYSNNEGYSDPTAELAIAQADKEAKEGKKIRFPYMPLVYICSRYAGDVEMNKKKAIRFCRYAIGEGCIPVASHLLYPQMLDDSDPVQRQLGLYFGLVLLGRCNQLWVLNDGGISPGMEAEIKKAKQRNMTIRWFKTDGVEEDGNGRV